jgi:hypothetical protein
MRLSLEEVVEDTLLWRSAYEGYPDSNIRGEKPSRSRMKQDFRSVDSMFLS